MNEEQQKQATWWRYLTRGISYKHKTDWYNTTLKNEGFEEAELFLARVKYSNKVEL